MSALSPAGKEYSEIICPHLEVLECDSKLVTGITEQGLRDFVQARRQAHIKDQRIAPLRKLCISINDYKQEVPVDEEVSLGEDSAVYSGSVKITPFLLGWAWKSRRTRLGASKPLTSAR
ncbi:hypothetical protein BDQ17DRAFT_1439481 [Cyathus striatus]|nr:hypothetical protein BDQ17DRAFT_1439481 [Cyathus striatus]